MPDVRPDQVNAGPGRTHDQYIHVRESHKICKHLLARGPTTQASPSMYEFAGQDMKFGDDPEECVRQAVERRNSEADALTKTSAICPAGTSSVPAPSQVDIKQGVHGLA